MKKEKEIPKEIIDIVRNDIENRIKILKITESFIQYKVQGYTDVYNISMRDPETKPQWFADYEEKQLAFNSEMLDFKKDQLAFNSEMLDFKKDQRVFNKDQRVFNKSILERIDNLVKKNSLKE